MTRSDELDANRLLAELLGWTGIVDVGGALLGTPPAGMPQCRGQAKVPDWMGDWRDCAPLILRHRVVVAPTAFNTRIGGRWIAKGCDIHDERTARAMIVAAVMLKLQGAAAVGATRQEDDCGC